MRDRGSHAGQLYLLFACRVAQTMMRMAMGPLVVYICTDMPNCDTAARGQLLSAFSTGYVLTQIGGGLLADRIGAKRVIFVAMAGAGACTLATPSAAAWGIPGLYASQFVMGLFQGPLFPTSIAYMSPWLQQHERTWASTLLDTGITAGSVVALPLSGLLAASFGWRAAFQAFGLATLAFAGVWHALAWEAKPHARPPENSAPENTATAALAASKPPPFDLLHLIRRPPVLAIFTAHAAFNFAVYFLNSWAPTYYFQVLGAQPEDAAVDFALPHIVNLGVKIMAVPLFKRLQLRGLTLTDCRRLFSAAGFAGTSFALLLLIPAGTFGGAEGILSRIASTGCLVVTMGFVGLHPSGFKANYMDVSLHRSGGIAGVGNTIASIASALSPLVVARILDVSNSWSMVFIAIVGAQVIGGVVFSLYATAEPLDLDVPPAADKVYSNVAAVFGNSSLAGVQVSKSDAAYL